MRVRLNNIHTVRAKGRTYHYHRKTRARLPGQPGSPEFMAAYNAEEAATENPSRAVAGTFGELVESYKRTPEYKGLAPRTKRDYRKIIDYLEDALFSRPHNKITTGRLMTLRDRICEDRNWKFANDCIMLIGRIFKLAKLKDKVSSNPAIGIPKLKRPKDKPKANRRWTDGELDAMLSAAKPSIRAAIALSAYAGLREGDALRLPWSARQNGWINTNQGKTGEPVWVPEHSRLTEILNDTPRLGTVIVIGDRRKPYTEDGFRTMFTRLREELLAARKVGQGLTFHGLRHTFATWIADEGATDEEVQSVTGHKSRSMVEVYTREADQKRRAKRAMSLIDKNG